MWYLSTTQKELTPLNNQVKQAWEADPSLSLQWDTLHYLQPQGETPKADSWPTETADNKCDWRLLICQYLFQYFECNHRSSLTVDSTISALLPETHIDTAPELKLYLELSKANWLSWGYWLIIEEFFQRKTFFPYFLYFFIYMYSIFAESMFLDCMKWKQSSMI